MSVELAQLGISIRSDGVLVATDRLDKMERQSKKTETSVQRLTRQADRMGREMGKLGRTLSMRVTAPLLALAGASIKLGTDFESSLSKMVTLVGLTRDEVGAFRSEILDLAPAVGRTATELSSALFAVTSAGQRGAQAMDTLEKAAKASAVGLGDTRQIALASVAAVQAYGAANLDASRSMEILIGTIEQGNLEAESLTPVLGRVIGIASELGVAFEDVGAFIATFSRLGVAAAESTTALRGILSTLLRPTTETSETFERMGLTVQGFRQQIQDDGFINAFQMLVNRSRELNVDISDLIPNVRALSGVLGVFGGEGNTAQEVLAGVAGAVGTLEDRFKAVQELDPAFAVAQFRAEMNVMFIEISANLLPAFLSLLEHLRDAIRVFRDLEPQTQKNAIAFLALTAAIGPALIVVGATIRSIRILIPLMLALNKAIIAIKATLTVVAGIFAAVAGAIALVALAIQRKFTPGMDEVAFSAQVLMVVTGAWVILRETALGVGEVILGLAVTIVGAFRAIISPIEGSIRALALATDQLLEGNVRGALSAIGGVGEQIAQTYTKAQQTMERGVGFLTESVSTRVENAVRETSRLQDELLGVGAAAEDSEGKIRGLGMGIQGLVDRLMNLSGPAAPTATIDQIVQASREFEIQLMRMRAELDGPLAQAMLEYELSLEEVRKLQAEGKITVDQLTRAEALYAEQLQATLKELRDSVDMHDAHIKAARDHAIAIDEASIAIEDMAYALEAEISALEGGEAAWREYQKALFIEQQMPLLDPEVAKVMGAELDKLRKKAEDLWDAMESDRAQRTIRDLANSFHPLADEMQRLGDVIQQIDLDLNAGLITDAQAGLAKFGVVANAAFSAMMQGVDQSSKEYEKLRKAQEVVNVALGIAAILQQGMGDPYTAIPRMIAMAAMVASMGVNTGGISGGAAQRRQETQGTGTVLGDAEAKSESILRASDITADATSKLVGINRGMLSALRAMQAGIAGAAGQIARGAGGIDTSQINPGMSGLESLLGRIDPIGMAIDSFLGGLFGFGKTKIVDQGIALIGGAITEMTEGAVGLAFAEAKRKSLFGNRRTTGFEDLDDAFNAQLNLIFQSMIDTVSAAGEALGIPLSDIESRIASFEVQAQQISLMDLSAEEQQDELEAVFSSIFDGLAGHVVPFVEQFQQVGEGLGETLVRVATSVQVTQEAVRRLGFALDETDPERVAQISVGLVEMAGGVDQFINSMLNFFDKFASDSVKFEAAQSDLNRALGAVGLALPPTRDAMWELMQSLDATTEAGREHIAILLELGDIADAYYKELERIENERLGLERQLLQLAGDTVALRALELEKLDESNRALQEHVWMMQDEAQVRNDLLNLLSSSWAEFDQMNRAMADTWNRAEALGASEEHLARIRRLHQLQLDQFVHSLRESIAALNEQLFGQEEAFGSFNRTVSNSANNMRDSIIRGLQSVQDWLDRSLLDQFSTLMPEQRKDEAGSQFRAAIAAVQSGDMSRLGDLPGLADAFRREGASFYGTSTDAFKEIEDEVRAAMQQVAGITPPQEAVQQQIAEATRGTERSTFETALLARDLIGQIALLSEITGKSPAEIAANEKLNMAAIIEALTGDLPGLTGDALAEYFNELVDEVSQEIQVLMDIEALNIAQLSMLESINQVLVDIATGTPGELLPGYATGGYVPNTGPANMHSGEWVIPTQGGPVIRGNDSAMTELAERMAGIERRLEEGNRQRGEQTRVTGEGFGAVVNAEREVARKLDQSMQPGSRRNRQPA